MYSNLILHNVIKCQQSYLKFHAPKKSNNMLLLTYFFITSNINIYGRPIQIQPIDNIYQKLLIKYDSLDNFEISYCFIVF